MLSIGLVLILESKIHQKEKKHAAVSLTGSLVQPVLQPSPLLLVGNAGPVLPILANERLMGHVAKANGLNVAVSCKIEGHG